MNTIDKFLNKISLDERITDGIFEITNNDHLDIFQEYLEKMGATTDESIEFRNKMIEGKHPERQAYNTNGILVTFPTPEYKQRALQRGTHFEKNPKAGQSNLKFTPQGSVKAPPAPTPPPAPAAPVAPAAVPTTEPAPAAPAAPVAPPPPKVVTTPVLVLPAEEIKRREEEETKAAQSEYVEKILSTEGSYTLQEAKNLNFYKKGNNWFSPDGEYVGTQTYDEHKDVVLISK